MKIYYGVVFWNRFVTSMRGAQVVINILPTLALIFVLSRQTVLLTPTQQISANNRCSQTSSFITHVVSLLWGSQYKVGVKTKLQCLYPLFPLTPIPCPFVWEIASVSCLQTGSHSVVPPSQCWENVSTCKVLWTVPGTDTTLWSQWLSLSLPQESTISYYKPSPMQAQTVLFVSYTF
jgi:hypothetical protein